MINRLMSVLEPQCNNDVEILVEKDQGQLSIGAKRNKLLKRATANFLCFIDDDDLVSKNYVEKILDALSDKPDCCGLEGIMTTNDQNPKKFIHSIRYNKWFEEDNVYYRTPNHLNPISRELALSVMFPETNHGEDRNFSDRIYPYLKKENYIDDIIYYYLFTTQKQKLIIKSQTLAQKVAQKMSERKNIIEEKKQIDAQTNMNIQPGMSKYRVRNRQK